MGPAMEGLLSGLEQKILELLVHLEAAHWVLCPGVTVRVVGRPQTPDPSQGSLHTGSSSWLFPGGAGSHTSLEPTALP